LIDFYIILTLTFNPKPNLGEFLSLTQAGKEGIYMYVDRSLYETVHFWKEPTAPTPVADSVSLIDEGASLKQFKEEIGENRNPEPIP
jgi:hypothetical protein